MSRRRVRGYEPDSDYDSFLDIVANLVGILVILIMVIGVRAKNAWQSTQHSKPPAVQTADSDTPPPQATLSPDIPADTGEDPSTGELAAGEERVPEIELPDVETPRMEVVRLQIDSAELGAEAERIQHESEIQRVRRDRLQLLVSSIEQRLADHRTRLDDETRDRLEKKRLVQERHRTLIRLNENIQTVSTAQAEPEILEHYPTPLAKTVFGQEEHYRLLNGRLAHLPINDFTIKLGSDARANSWKLKDAKRVTETFGPLEGFLVKYTLVASQQRIPTENGMVTRRGVQLERFVLVPTSTVQEFTLEDALAPNSELRRRLSGLDPAETTVTVWTYPDSYSELLALKTELLKSGFLVAARPLPQGYPIGGSPHGMKSAAQ